MPRIKRSADGEGSDAKSLIVENSIMLSGFVRNITKDLKRALLPRLGLKMRDSLALCGGVESCELAEWFKASLVGNGDSP